MQIITKTYTINAIQTQSHKKMMKK